MRKIITLMVLVLSTVTVTFGQRSPQNRAYYGGGGTQFGYIQQPKSCDEPHYYQPGPGRYVDNVFYYYRQYPYGSFPGEGNQQVVVRPYIKPRCTYHHHDEGALPFGKYYYDINTHRRYVVETGP